MNLEISEVDYALLEEHGFNYNFDEIIKDILERKEIEMRIPRKLHSLINDTIGDCLQKFALEGNLEERSCYLVKNITPDTNVCFVHKFSEAGKTFHNLEVSMLPGGVKKDDILVLKDGEFIVHTEITEKVAQIKTEFLKSYEESKKIFEVEGKEYFVSDKSDDDVRAQMSIKTGDGTAERTGVDINSELYHKISYGSKVRFESGKYVFVE